MKKTWFYERLFYESGNRHGKRLKRYNIKDAMSIKISFMHYMKSNDE